MFSGNLMMISLDLTRDKSKLEVEYEKLLTINETLAADLELAIRQKKNIQQEQVNYKVEELL